MNTIVNMWKSLLESNHAQMVLFFSFFWAMFYFSIYMFWSLHRKYKLDYLADAVIRKKMSIRYVYILLTLIHYFHSFFF